MIGKRIDGNHFEVVDALRSMSPPCFVQSLAGVGRGCPDLLAWWAGRPRWVVIEVKDGTRPPSRRRLNDAQKTWHRLAANHGAEVYVAKSAAEAVAIMEGAAFN